MKIKNLWIMFRKFIKPVLLLHFFLIVTSNESLLSKTQKYKDKNLQEKEDKLFIDYLEIENIVSQNNLELK